jgi:hypothetical protein
MKSRYLSALIVFLLMNNISHSQNTFKTIFQSPFNGSVVGSSIIELDSTYLFVDYGFNTILREFDMNGIMIYNHYFNPIIGIGGGFLGSKSCIFRDADNVIMLLVGSDSLYRVCITSL